MKIVRTLCFVSASVVGVGLLSSCATDGHHHHHRHHHGYHDHYQHHAAKKSTNQYARSQAQSRAPAEARAESRAESQARAQAQDQRRWQRTGRSNNSNDNQANPRRTDDRQANRASQKRFAMSFDDLKSKARIGDADAQYALGYMYYYGQDVQRDADKAKFWIRKAAAQGQKRAVTALKMLGESTQLASAADNAPADSGFERSNQSQNTANNERRSNDYTERNQVAQKQAFQLSDTNPQPKQSAQTETRSKQISKANESTKLASQSTATDSTPKRVKSTSVSTVKTAAKKAETKIAAKPKSEKSTPVVASKSEELDTTNAQLTSGEKILLSMPNDRYTLQLFGARKIETAEKIIAENKLDSNAKIFHSTFKDKDWFVLVYGDYNSPSEAMAAVGNLPTAVQKLKPWVKPIAAVKESIRASLVG